MLFFFCQQFQLLMDLCSERCRRELKSNTSFYYKSVHVSTVCTLFRRHFHMFDKSEPEKFMMIEERNKILHTAQKTDINKGEK